MWAASEHMRGIFEYMQSVFQYMHSDYGYMLGICEYMRSVLRICKWYASNMFTRFSAYIHGIRGIYAGYFWNRRICEHMQGILEYMHGSFEYMPGIFEYMPSIVGICWRYVLDILTALPANMHGILGIYAGLFWICRAMPNKREAFSGYDGGLL